MINNSLSDKELNAKKHHCHFAFEFSPLGDIVLPVLFDLEDN